MKRAGYEGVHYAVFCHLSSSHNFLLPLRSTYSAQRSVLIHTVCFLRNKRTVV